MSSLVALRCSSLNSHSSNQSTNFLSSPIALSSSVVNRGLRASAFLPATKSKGTGTVYLIVSVPFYFALSPKYSHLAAPLERACDTPYFAERFCSLHPPQSAVATLQIVCISLNLSFRLLSQQRKQIKYKANQGLAIGNNPLCGLMYSVGIDPRLFPAEE